MIANIPVFKVALLLTNGAMISFLVSLIREHYKSNYNINSFANIFHMLSFIWLSIRGLFWLLTIVSTKNWDTILFYILYWMPSPIQFASFMLLPLFCAQIVYPQEWKKYWTHVRMMYVCVTVGMVAFQIVWTILISLQKARISQCTSNNKIETCIETEYSSDAFRLITSLSFLTLGGLQILYGLKIFSLDKKTQERFLSSSPNTLIGINIALFLSFVSRGLYQLGAMHYDYILPDIPLQGSADVTFSVFAVFQIWEYLPTMLLVCNITSRALGSSHRRSESLKSINHSPSHSAYIPIASNVHIFPQYGSIFRKLNDPEELNGLASSLTSVSSSLGLDVAALSAGSAQDAFLTKRIVLALYLRLNHSRARTRACLNTTILSYPFAVSFLTTIFRFEAPASLLPTSTWLVGAGSNLHASMKYARPTSARDPSADHVGATHDSLLYHYRSSRGRNGSFGSFGGSRAGGDGGQNSVSSEAGYYIASPKRFNPSFISAGDGVTDMAKAAETARIRVHNSISANLSTSYQQGVITSPAGDGSLLRAHSSVDTFGSSSSGRGVRGPAKQSPEVAPELVVPVDNNTYDTYDKVFEGDHSIGAHRSPSRRVVTNHNAFSSPVVQQRKSGSGDVAVAPHDIAVPAQSPPMVTAVPRPTRMVSGVGGQACPVAARISVYGSDSHINGSGAGSSNNQSCSNSRNDSSESDGLWATPERLLLATQVEGRRYINAQRRRDQAEGILPGQPSSL